MSLAGLLNKSMYLYTWTKGGSYPYDEKIWSLNSTIPCYVSDAKITTVLSNGMHMQIRVKRFRSEPYTCPDGARILYDGHIYDTQGDGLGYENFDDLDMEAITIAKIMDDSVKTEMGII